MSAETRVRGERRVRAGCLEEFKQAAAEAMQRHRELGGPGTLSFDTFLDESRGIWVALEHYVDSQAMLKHLAVRDPELTRRISQVSDIGHSEVFGTPSPSSRRSCQLWVMASVSTRLWTAWAP